MNNNSLLFEQHITKDFLNKKMYNQILFESDNFIVIPSLGSLVEGWLLIVPKNYALSMGQLESDQLDELDSLSNKVTSILKAEYGEVTIFEHGAAFNNTVVGCGVDYAHLHIVPIKIDLIQELENVSETKYDWKTISGLDFSPIYAKQNLPYLYIKNYEGKCYITSNNDIPSQLFRRVIATYIDKPDQFDWKTFPEISNIERTINRLSKYSQFYTQNTLSHGRATN